MSKLLLANHRPLNFYLKTANFILKIRYLNLRQQMSSGILIGWYLRGFLSLFREEPLPGLRCVPSISQLAAAYRSYFAGFLLLFIQQILWRRHHIVFTVVLVLQRT